MANYLLHVKSIGLYFYCTLKYFCSTKDSYIYKITSRYVHMICEDEKPLAILLFKVQFVKECAIEDLWMWKCTKKEYLRVLFKFINMKSAQFCKRIIYILLPDYSRGFSFFGCLTFQPYLKKNKYNADFHIHFV